MASPTRTLTVNFVGRDKNLQKSFKRVSKGSQLMSDKLMRATRMAGVGFAALGGVAVGTAMALKPMIDKAADVEESLSKNSVVFGESAKAVEEFATRSLQAFGVTRREALEATGVIGTLGSAMGMAEADSAKMATTLVGLAGDMSSFNNASVEETLTAIQAGLRGENEPLRRFGVLLDAATLKAKALEKGIITSTKDALTPQAKALAAYAVILEQTQVQMGDFERTSDSATNQQKLFAGAVDDLQVAIGEMLLPTFTAAAAWMNENLVPWAQDLVERVESEGIFNTVGFQFGEFIQSGTALSLMGWKNDDAWWERNWGSWLLDKAKATAAGIGASLAPDEEADGPATRGPGSRGGRGGAAGAAPAGTDMMSIMAQLEEAAQAATEAAAEAKAEPMPGLSAAEIEVMVNNAAAKAAADALANAAAAAAVDEAFSEAFNEPSKEASAAAAADAGGAAAAAAAAADAEVAAWLGSPGAQAMFAGFTGDPGQRGGATTVNNHFNITGVSPSEVMDAIGQAVDLTGPMPPHWQQSATD